MILALLTCLLQEKDEFKELCKRIEEAQKDVRFLAGDLGIETSGKVEDSSNSFTGKFSWRVKEKELLTEATSRYEEGAKPVRTLLKGDEATIHITKEKRAEIYRAAEVPLVHEILRQGIHEKLKEAWDVEFASRPDETKLPDLHTKKDGEEKPEDKPKPPDAKLPGTRGANAMTDVEAEEGKYIVLRLAPKKEPLKGYLQEARVFVHKDSLRIEKVVLETTMETVVARYSNMKAVEEMGELSIDLTGVKVERK